VIPTQTRTPGKLSLSLSNHVKLIDRYLDVGNGRDLFFYFFESRNKPSEDPVIMWINGIAVFIGIVDRKLMIQVDRDVVPQWVCSWS
jgi:hypothetical protein